MSYFIDVKRTQAFAEMSESERKHWFDLRQKKVVHQIDTFYYSIYLKELECENAISDFIEELKILRTQAESSEKEVKVGKLIVRPARFAGYCFCLSEEENFDVFITEALPNPNVPRIVVQIRARFLWLHKPKIAVNKSYNAVKKILDNLGVEIDRLQENRIDYAYHNNCIQNPDKYLTTEKLKKYCKTKLRRGLTAFNTQDYKTDYFSLGQRGKSVFFRFYNKSQEVVEQNYKNFFIDLWYKKRLINAFDKYVMEYAFSQKSFNVGVIIGRLKWYLQYGKDPEIKDLCLKLLMVNYKDSDNTKNIKLRIAGLIPDITIVTNFEFETRRSFYRSCEKTISQFEQVTDNQHLDRLYKLIANRKVFLDYLTDFTGTVAFVKDRTVRVRDFQDDYLDFWKKIRSVKTECKLTAKLLRTYERNLSKDLARCNFEKSVATLSVYKQGENSQDLTIDISAALSYYNDNDMHYIISNNGEVVDFHSEQYEIIKARKNRQLRNILGKQKKTTPPDEVL